MFVAVVVMLRRVVVVCCRHLSSCVILSRPRVSFGLLGSKEFIQALSRNKRGSGAGRIFKSPKSRGVADVIDEAGKLMENISGKTMPSCFVTQRQVANGFRPLELCCENGRSVFVDVFGAIS